MNPEMSSRGGAFNNSGGGSYRQNAFETAQRQTSYDQCQNGRYDYQHSEGIDLSKNRLPLPDSRDEPRMGYGNYSGRQRKDDDDRGMERSGFVEPNLLHHIALGQVTNVSNRGRFGNDPDRQRSSQQASWNAHLHDEQRYRNTDDRRRNTSPPNRANYEHRNEENCNGSFRETQLTFDNRTNAPLKSDYQKDVYQRDMRNLEREVPRYGDGDNRRYQDSDRNQNDRSNRIYNESDHSKRSPDRFQERRGGFNREQPSRGGYELADSGTGFAGRDNHVSERKESGFSRNAQEDRHDFNEGFNKDNSGRGFTDCRNDNRIGLSRNHQPYDSETNGNNNSTKRFLNDSTFIPTSSIRTFERSGPTNQMSTRAASRWMPAKINVDILYEMDRENVRGDIYGDDSEILVNGSLINDRFDSWENAPLDPRLRATCRDKCGYPRPRNIQSAFIPQVLDGYDILGQAETGSGKTAAFALPILEKIIQIKKQGNSNKTPPAPYALILSPTRELTEQLYKQFVKFAAGTNVNIFRSYGQLAREISVGEINTGCDVLIGCIGRILDLIKRGDLRLNCIMFFVLDECDRLLDPKSIQEIMDIAADMPPPGKRQTLMMSATINDEFQRVAEQLINTRRLCRIKAASLNKKIIHEFYKVKGTFDKDEQLFNILKKEFENANKEGKLMPRTLIFVSKKLKAHITAVEICKRGSAIGVQAESICSDNDQQARNRIINSIDAGKSRILVGTDLCERGLDINNLEVVINYDMPPEVDRYTHRTGRTGRLKPGRAYNLVDIGEPEALKDIKLIIQKVKDVGQTVPEWLEKLEVGETSSMRPGNFSQNNGSSGFNGFNSTRAKGGGFGRENGFRRDAPFKHNGGFNRQIEEKSGFSHGDGGFKANVSTNEGGFKKQNGNSFEGGFKTTNGSNSTNNANSNSFTASMGFQNKASVGFKAFGGFTSLTPKTQENDDWGDDDVIIKKDKNLKAEEKPPEVQEEIKTNTENDNSETKATESTQETTTEPPANDNW